MQNIIKWIKSSENLSKSGVFLAFFVPAVLWLYFHNWGNIAPSGDGHICFHWILYHFTFLLRGEFPFWNPYQSWGWLDVFILQSGGLLNPFLLLTSLLRLLNVPAIYTFNFFLIFLFFACAATLSFLVRQLTGNRLAAWIAYVLFLLSTQGGLLFTQLIVLLVVWTTANFFCFLIGFARAKDLNTQTKYFLGLVFSLMLVASTYVPAFFLLLFFSVFLFACIFSLNDVLSFFKKSIGFVSQRLFLSLAGLSSVVLSLLPAAYWYFSNKSQDLVWLTARDGFGQTGGALRPSEFMVNVSGLAAQVTPMEIFSDLDLGYATWSYIPIFVMILLGLGAFVRMSRWQLCVFFSGVFFLLFCLADVTPVHQFIVRHLGILQMQRNLYFGGPILFALLIILSAGFVSRFCALDLEKMGRLRPMAAVSFVHAALLFLLFRHEQVIMTSFLTVAASFVFFSLSIFGVLKRKTRVFGILLLFLLALQPGEVMRSYVKDLGPIRGPLTTVGPAPFSYLRPMKGAHPEQERLFNEFPKPMQDISGFVGSGYVGTMYAYKLFKNVSGEDLKNYVAHKFVLYERTQFMDPERMDWKKVALSLQNVQSPAWVHEPSHQKVSGQDAAQFIRGETEQLKVAEFTTNRIRIQTNFLKEKFLVYNDSFYPGWRAFIDGRPVELIRANAAFKGVWVGSGEHVIDFKFGFWWQHFLGWGLTILFLFWLFGTVFSFVRGARERKVA